MRNGNSYRMSSRHEYRNDRSYDGIYGNYMPSANITVNKTYVTNVTHVAQVTHAPAPRKHYKRHSNDKPMRKPWLNKYIGMGIVDPDRAAKVSEGDVVSESMYALKYAAHGIGRSTKRLLVDHGQLIDGIGLMGKGVCEMVSTIFRLFK